MNFKSFKFQIMSRKSVTFFLFALLTLGGFRVSAQTAEDIINKHIEAMGGLEKLKSITSLHMQSVMVMQNGTEITINTYKDQGKLFRRDVDFGMGTSSTIVTDKEGWMSNPRNGGAFEAMPAEMLKNQQSELDCADPLVDFAAKGNKAELIGKETVDGIDCYKIKLTLASGRDINYFIDSKTFYIVQTTFKGGGMMGGGGRPPGGGQGNAGGGGGGGQRPGGADAETKISYSDFKKTPEGFVFPYHMAVGGMGAGMNYEKIEVNKPIDKKLYKPE